jgi:hypothetical protein
MIFPSVAQTHAFKQRFIEKFFDEALFGFSIENEILPNAMLKRNILFPLIKSPFYSLFLKMEHVSSPVST